MLHLNRTRVCLCARADGVDCVTMQFPKTFDFAKGENKPYKNAKVKGGTVTAADTKYAQQKNPWDL